MGYQKQVLIFLITLVLTPLISGTDEVPESFVIKPYCTSTCGGIAIPYPFGIEEGCYYKDKDESILYPTMRITCNHTFNPPKPIYGDDIDILNISLKEGEIRLNNDVSYNCRKPDNSTDGVHNWINLRNFTISSSKNKFVATGCDTSAWFKGTRYGKPYSTGCMTMCNELDDVVNGSRCNGVGCCEASLPDGVTNVTTRAYSFNNHTDVEFNPCSVAYTVANDAFYFSTQNLTQSLSYYMNEQPSTPIVYNWGIGTKNCSKAEKEGSRFLCKNNTKCINLTHEQDGLDGYRCSCKDGYSGNPYLPKGCQGRRYGKNYSTGCMTTCNELDDVANDNICNGVGCCEASLPDGVTNVTIEAHSFYNHTLLTSNPCSVAYSVANDAFYFSQQNLTLNSSFYLKELPLAPIVYNWGIGTKNCSEAEKEGSRFLCKSNTDCINLTHEQHGLDGYRCQCKDGYSGNPYLPQGCQDIDECKGANECEKPEYCTNIDGSYNCECPKGYHGNGTRADRCISSPKSWLTPVIITAGIGGSIIILLMAGFLLHWRNGERRIKQLRETFFRQNGGLILHQKLSRMDALKIFTAQDLEIATDKYNEMNIIGRGGYGIVYKGIIANNQQVAIKRSLKVDPGQVEQFINEVLIFSQINNRNVVRILGCCLETEVPLLVYEYINNGTLYDHLNDEAKVPLFTWNIRLGIATEVAEVLAYLHTTISTPIIHRDIKSMNILLDECYTAKVADFGGSRLIPVDQGQLATMVLGTLGYLDPEYMQTSELTEKSDVYSFGVVLVELLTRKKALSYQRPGIERCLAMHFLLKMKEDRLFDIIDKNIANSQGGIEQIKKVATLAKRCLFLKGEDRPTMKEVAMELEGIKRMNKHPWQDGKSSLDQEHDCEYLLRGIPKDDDGNSGGNSGKDSDLYKPPSFISSLGGGR